MKVSGSHIEKIESMSQNLFRIKEEQTIQIATEKLSKEGKHVINIIHGTPSSLMGTVTKTLTFLWEADDDDPAYKRAKQWEEEKNNIKFRINICKQDIQSLKSRIRAAERVDSDPAIARKKNDKQNKLEEVLLPILGAVFSPLFFIFAKEFEGFGSFICVCFGLITLGAGIFNLYDGIIKKLIKPDEYKKRHEEFLDYIESETKNALIDKSKLSDLRKQLTEKEKELARLEMLIG